MNTPLRIVVALVAASWASTGFSEQTLATASDLTAKVAQAREANATLMHQYTWNSRTEILSDGQVKDIRIELVNYGPYGQLQHTLLNDQPSSGLPLGFLRRAIAQEKKQEMQQYLTGLQGLLEQYTLPTSQKVFGFIMGATPSGPDANGQFEISGFNVVQPGDNLNIWINPWTRHPTHFQVNTTFQGNAVQLSATFATLPGGGLNYVSFAEATVPAKQLSVQVQNFNYSRNGQ
jgi:hypothetical protein